MPNRYKIFCPGCGITIELADKEVRICDKCDTKIRFEYLFGAYTIEAEGSMFKCEEKRMEATDANT